MLHKKHLNSVHSTKTILYEHLKILTLIWLKYNPQLRLKNHVCINKLNSQETNIYYILKIVAIAVK